MKEMIRLKTTTLAGKIFLSPFVFHKKEAVRRIENPALEDKGNTTEMLPMSIYPYAAVWTKKRFGSNVILIETLISRVIKAEKAWEVMKLAYNREDT